MTTKGPLRKQVIILMNSDNIVKFMKESLLHVSNINRALKNVKSEVLVNFIRSKQSGITVVTNKVVSSSDLLIIKNYIQNVEYIDISGVNVPHSKQSLSMICNNLKLYSQNIHKNSLIINTILET